MLVFSLCPRTCLIAATAPILFVTAAIFIFKSSRSWPHSVYAVAEAPSVTLLDVSGSLSFVHYTNFLFISVARAYLETNHELKVSINNPFLQYTIWTHYIARRDTWHVNSNRNHKKLYIKRDLKNIENF